MSISYPKIQSHTFSIIFQTTAPAINQANISNQRALFSNLFTLCSKSFILPEVN